MFTFYAWKEINLYSLYDIFLGVLLSAMTIPIDLILVPFEIIAFIIYKIANKEKRKINDFD